MPPRTSAKGPPVPTTTLDPIISFIHARLNGDLPFNKSSVAGNHRGFIIHAAKQRNLTVKNLSQDHCAFFDQGIAVGGMYKMVTSLVSHPAISATNSKPMTKQLLAKAGVPVPAGRSFSQNHFDEAAEYFQQQQKPMVIKPANGRAGDGITTNVSDLAQFDRAWSRAVEASTSKHKIMLEAHVTGLDVRAFVVGDRVVAAATRLPAFVQGNGQDSLVDLVEAKSSVRAENAYLRKMPIQVDYDWLAGRGWKATAVPEDGEIVLLNGTVNIHQGGEHVDITHELSPELQQIAVRAAQAIPGLTVAGIDLLVESPDSVHNAVVLEANTSANISVHHVPAYGQPVDVGGAIIDEMLRRAPRPPAKEPKRKGRKISVLARAQRLTNRLSQSLDPSPRAAF